MALCVWPTVLNWSPIQPDCTNFHNNAPTIGKRNTWGVFDELHSQLHDREEHDTIVVVVAERVDHARYEKSDKIKRTISHAERFRGWVLVGKSAAYTSPACC